MSYADRDTSVHDGAPIECYKFVAQHKTWYYTSHHIEVTIDSNVYEPLPITRTAIETSSVIDTLQTMDFNIPSDHEIVKTFCYTVSPKELEITVYGLHEGETDYKIEWIGNIVGASGSGHWATIETASKLQSKLNGPLSSVYYQRSCNHILYDERCQADRESHLSTTTVTKIQGQIITVADMGFPDDELVGGTMKNLRTGEEQGILTNESNVLRIGYPFFDLVVGDSLELVQGCDHLRLGHCKNRFNNVAHYGGFDFIPDKNPFENLQLTSSTSTTTDVRYDQSFRPFQWTVSGKII